MRWTSLAVGGGIAASALLLSCGGGGRWSAASFATCSPADHDRFVVPGPGGKLYPTWHPAVDPVKGCSYGHDHGQDPHGSALYAVVGDLPFGVATEALNTWDSNHPGHEGHNGQKIVWENGVRLQQVVDGEPIDIGVRCDFLVKTYQAGRRAPRDRVHELAYHVRCDDGTEIHATTLAPLNRPITIATAEGGSLAYYDPRFDQTGASRSGAANPNNPAELLMDLCYMVDSSSDEAHSRDCQAFPNFGKEMLVEFNQTSIYNGGGPTVWFTDPFGAHASTTPFPGSVRQFIAPVTNDRGFALAGQTFALETARTSQYLK